MEKHTGPLSRDWWSFKNQLRMNFQMPIVSAFPESPLDEGREAWITAFGKTIGKIIEHSFYPLLTLFEV